MIIYMDYLPPVSMLLISINNESVSCIVMWSYNTLNNPFKQLHTQTGIPFAASLTFVLIQALAKHS